MIDENLNVSISLIEATKEQKVKSFAFASTSAVYGEPKYLPVDEELIPLAQLALMEYQTII